MARYRKVRNASGQMGWARMVPFTYTLPIVTTALAAGSSQTLTLQIDPGLPFILYELGCAVDADGATLTNFTQWGFTILDGESQQLFSNGEAPRERMFGTRDFPRQLPSEVDISPADQLTVTAFNRTGAAQTTTVRVTFSGYKLVGFTQAQPE